MTQGHTYLEVPWPQAPHTWRPHGPDELDVSELDGGGLLEVVPVAVVKELSKELNGGLSAVRLSQRHVDVVDKHYLHPPND